MNIVHLALNEIAKSRRSKISLIIPLLMPVLMVFLMGNALKPSFELEKGIPKFAIGYLNQDKGPIGQRLELFLRTQAANTLDLVNLEPGQLDQAIASGAYPLAVIVQEGLSTKLAAGEEAQVQILVSAKDPVKEDLVRMLLNSFTDHLNTLTNLGRALGSTEFDTLEAKFAQSQSRFGSDFIHSEQPFKLTSYQFFAASMLVFFLLTTGMGVGLTIVGERNNKTFDRIKSFPVSMNQYLLGKVLANAATAVLQAIVLISSTRILFGVNWGNDPLGLSLIILCVITISSAIGILFSSLFTTTRTLTAASVAIFWLMTFISGGFTSAPLFGPLANATINKWAFESIGNIMTGSRLPEISGHLLVLVVTGLILWLTGLILYNRRVSYE